MCEKTQQEVLDLLARDYEKLVLQLTNYALKLIRGRTWRGEAMPPSGRGVFLLPGGKSAEDVVLDVFRKLLDETRNWDSQAHPDLLVVLKGMVRSEISAACKRDENTTTLVLAEPEGQEGASFEKCIEPHEAKIDRSAGLLPPQEHHPGAADYLSIAQVEIAAGVERAAQSNPDLLKVIEAIKVGGEKSGEIAEYCGLPVEKVYELKRTLNIISADVTRKVLSSQSPQPIHPGGNQ